MILMHIYHMLRAAIDNNETIAMITVIRYSRNCNEDSLTINEGLKLLIWPNGHMYCPVELPKPWVDHMLIHATKVFDSNISRAFQDRIADDDIEYYVEVYPSPIHLIVAGAGHVAKPVVQFGSLLGFYITVIC